MYDEQIAALRETVEEAIRQAEAAARQEERLGCRTTEAVWTSRLTDALSDNSTVDFYDISVDGIKNLAGIAAREVRTAIKARND